MAAPISTVPAPVKLPPAKRPTMTNPTMTKEQEQNLLSRKTGRKEVILEAEDWCTKQKTKVKSAKEMIEHLKIKFGIPRASDKV